MLSPATGTLLTGLLERPTTRQAPPRRRTTPTGFEADLTIRRAAPEDAGARRRLAVPDDSRQLADADARAPRRQAGAPRRLLGAFAELLR